MKLIIGNDMVYLVRNARASTPPYAVIPTSATGTVVVTDADGATLSTSVFAWDAALNGWAALILGSLAVIDRQLCPVTASLSDGVGSTWRKVESMRCYLEG